MDLLNTILFDPDIPEINFVEEWNDWYARLHTTAPHHYLDIYQDMYDTFRIFLIICLTSLGMYRVLSVYDKTFISVWYLISHTALNVFGIYALSTVNWGVFTPRLWWEDYPFTTIEPAIRWYYLTQLANCLNNTVIVYTLHTRNIIEMSIHHILMASMLILSYTWGYYRTCVAVLVLHEYTDPLIESAKLLVYTGYKTLADIVFTLFAFTFITTRLYIVPRYVLGSIYVDAKETCYTYPPPFQCNGYWTFITLLTGLTCLHVYWAFVIIRAACQMVFGKGIKQNVD